MKPGDRTLMRLAWTGIAMIVAGSATKSIAAVTGPPIRIVPVGYVMTVAGATIMLVGSARWRTIGRAADRDVDGPSLVDVFEASSAVMLPTRSPSGPQLGRRGRIGAPSTGFRGAVTSRISSASPVDSGLGPEPEAPFGPVTIAASPLALAFGSNRDAVHQRVERLPEAGIRDVHGGVRPSTDRMPAPPCPARQAATASRRKRSPGGSPCGRQLRCEEVPDGGVAVGHARPSVRRPSPVRGRTGSFGDTNLRYRPVSPCVRTRGREPAHAARLPCRKP